MERFIYQSIPLNKIAVESRFCYRRNLKDDKLAESIKRRGLLQAPVLVRRGDFYEIVAGFRRIEAVRHLGWSEMSALIVQDHAADNDADLILVSIVSNMNQAWTDVDQLSALQLAKTVGVEVSMIVDVLLPAMGLEPSSQTWDIFSRRLKLAPAALQSILEGDLPCKNSEYLALLDAIDQNYFVTATRKKMFFSASQLKQCAEWLSEILKTRREGLNVFFQHSDIDSIIRSEHADKRQVADRFLKAVRKIRFPALARAEDQFRKVSHQLDSEDLQIEAPVYFEDEGFTLRLRAKNKETLETAFRVLEQKKSLLRSLFDFMI